MKINPLWHLWLVPSTILLIAGSVILNDWLKIPFLPIIALIIQLIFIVYCFCNYKENKK